MTQISFEFRNAKLVSKSLQNLRAELPKIARYRIYEMLTKIVKRFKRYPPRRAGQRYIRTFKMQRAWRIRRSGKMGYTIANRVSFRGKLYAKYPVGDASGEGQAWMHKGRWQVLRDELERAFAQMPKAIANNVHFFVRARGWIGARSSY